jgi:hypothetical protein
MATPMTRGNPKVNRLVNLTGCPCNVPLTSYLYNPPLNERLACSLNRVCVCVYAVDAVIRAVQTDVLSVRTLDLARTHQGLFWSPTHRRQNAIPRVHCTLNLTHRSTERSQVMVRIATRLFCYRHLLSVNSFTKHAPGHHILRNRNTCRSFFELTGVRNYLVTQHLVLRRRRVRHERTFPILCYPRVTHHLPDWYTQLWIRFDQLMQQISAIWKTNNVDF